MVPNEKAENGRREHLLIEVARRHSQLVEISQKGRRPIRFLRVHFDSLLSCGAGHIPSCQTMSWKLHTGNERLPIRATAPKNGEGSG